jgi:hypothetical protein
MDSGQVQIHASSFQQPVMQDLYERCGRQQIQAPSVACGNPNNNLKEDVPHPLLTPILNINGSQAQVGAESTDTSQLAWPTSISQPMRPRPVTIHESFSYCMGEAYPGFQSLDLPSFSVQQTPCDTISRPNLVPQGFYQTQAMESREFFPRLLMLRS